ncbi:threonylcarbamoyl-AMP synthase [Kineosporiaceae bacterium SCSIO 59966]|nr:threonylcarbamoyl-AMP synthase [Kineosporiaceae bacterium SCSIO 59966]
MSSLYDCTDADQRATGLRHAADALRRGELVVLPTDTVYGVGADAFTPAAVAALLEAKGRGREKPPPVLVPDARTLDGLATDVPDDVRALIERFWPGPLTVICRAQPSLHWDLGDTGGTVAVRMPHHEVALELLATTGPLAVSSANRAGRPPATTAAEAREQLGDSVAAYLEAGPTGRSDPSTILDATGGRLRVVRLGALGLEEVREVVPDVDGPGGA